jgi:hypothetical protein
MLPLKSGAVNTISPQAKGGESAVEKLEGM